MSGRVRKDKAYWIVYSRVSKKYPKYSTKQKHYITRYVLDRKE